MGIEFSPSDERIVKRLDRIVELLERLVKLQTPTTMSIHINPEDIIFDPVRMLEALEKRVQARSD